MHRKCTNCFPNMIDLVTGADLISLHNASDIFEIMGKANREERNTFQMGDVGALYKYYCPPEVCKEPSNDNLQNEEMIAEVDEGAPSSHMHIPDMPGRLNDNENDGDNIDEGSYCSTDVEKGESTQGDQICKPAIYSLRNRTVYSMLVVSNKHTNFSHLSIKNLQGIMTRDLYKATRKALRDHNSICDLENCYICDFSIEAKSYTFCPTNIRNTSLVTNDVLTRTLNSKKKVVSFAKDTIFHYQVNSATLNYTRVQQSTAANCSLLETNLLN